MEQLRHVRTVHFAAKNQTQSHHTRATETANFTLTQQAFARSSREIITKTFGRRSSQEYTLQSMSGMFTPRTDRGSYATVAFTGRCTACPSSGSIVRQFLMRWLTDTPRAHGRAKEHLEIACSICMPRTNAGMRTGTLLPTSASRTEQTHRVFVEFTRPPTGRRSSSSDPRSGGRRRPLPFDCSLHPATVVV